MNCCRTVTDFRKWLDKRGQGGPIKGDPGPILEDRRVLLDRYEQHVKHCKACTQVSPCCSTWLQLQSSGSTLYIALSAEGDPSLLHNSVSEQQHEWQLSNLLRYAMWPETTGQCM